MDLTWYYDTVDGTLQFLQGWGFILVIVFGLSHVIMSQPLYLFGLSLAIYLLGVPLGYTLLITSNFVGMLLFWYLTREIKKDNILKRWKISDKVFTWVRTTETWRHAIVIGAPTIPTFPIKLAIPLSGMPFKQYMKTMIQSYLVLLVSYSLIYFGVTNVLTDNLPGWVIVLIILFIVIYIYFGRRIFNRGMKSA